jgi:hypothetical protein
VPNHSRRSIALALALAVPVVPATAQVQKVDADLCIARSFQSGISRLVPSERRPAIILDGGVFCVERSDSRLAAALDPGKVDPRTIRELELGDFIVAASKSIVGLETGKASRQEIAAFRKDVEAASANQLAASRANMETVVKRLSEMPAEFAAQPAVVEVARSSLLSELQSSPGLRDALQRAVVEMIRSDPEFRRSILDAIIPATAGGTKQR